MNFLLPILFSLLHNTARDLPGVYKITDTHIDFSTIEVKNDGRFIYERRGSSCWTWQDIKGFWEQRKDTLILKSYHPSLRLEVDIEETIVPADSGKLTALFRTADGIPISDMKVEYIRSSAELSNQIEKTSSSGAVQFKKHSSPGRYTTLLFWFSDSTGTYPDFVFSWSKYNLIYVCVNPAPKNELWQRVEKFIITGNELRALETNSYYPATFKKE